jgi:hypothetical protein
MHGQATRTRTPRLSGRACSLLFASKSSRSADSWPTASLRTHRRFLRRMEGSRAGRLGLGALGTNEGRAPGGLGCVCMCHMCAGPHPVRSRTASPTRSNREGVSCDRAFCLWPRE